jgi:hypothetical protein
MHPNIKLLIRMGGMSLYPIQVITNRYSPYDLFTKEEYEKACNEAKEKEANKPLSNQYKPSLHPGVRNFETW